MIRDVKVAEHIENLPILFVFYPTAKGLVFNKGGDFEALHYQQSTNFDSRTKLDLTTKMPL